MVVVVLVDVLAVLLLLLLDPNVVVVLSVDFPCPCLASLKVKLLDRILSTIGAPPSGSSGSSLRSTSACAPPIWSAVPPGPFPPARAADELLLTKFAIDSWFWHRIINTELISSVRYSL